MLGVTPQQLFSIFEDGGTLTFQCAWNALLSLLYSKCCLSDTMRHSEVVWTDLIPLPTSFHLTKILLVSQLMWNLPFVVSTLLVLMSWLCISFNVRASISYIEINSAVSKALCNEVQLNADSSEFCIFPSLQKYYSGFRQSSNVCHILIDSKVLVAFIIRGRRNIRTIDVHVLHLIDNLSSNAYRVGALILPQPHFYLS